MKKTIFLLISLTLVLTGCDLIAEKDNISTVNKKKDEIVLDTADTTCSIDTDCEVKYNVKHEGECKAGCFHKDSEFCEDCKGKEWSKIDGGCTCEEGNCKLHTGERILLTMKNQDDYFYYVGPKVPGKLSQCAARFDQNSENEWVDYINNKEGISFKIPYNEKWGNIRFKIPQYERGGKNNNTLFFGALSTYEGCSFTRSILLYFKEAKSVEKLMNEIQKEIENENEEFKQKFKSPELLNMNGLQVVKFTSYGLGDPKSYIVVGKKYNYEFYSPLGHNQLIEEVIKTIEFI